VPGHPVSSPSSPIYIDLHDLFENEKVYAPSVEDFEQELDKLSTSWIFDSAFPAPLTDAKPDPELEPIFVDVPSPIFNVATPTYYHANELERLGEDDPFAHLIKLAEGAPQATLEEPFAIQEPLEELLSDEQRAALEEVWKGPNAWDDPQPTWGACQSEVGSEEGGLKRKRVHFEEGEIVDEEHRKVVQSYVNAYLEPNKHPKLDIDEVSTWYAANRDRQVKRWIGDCAWVDKENQRRKRLNRDSISRYLWNHVKDQDAIALITRFKQDYGVVA
jgi:hypothetical protein